MKRPTVVLGVALVGVLAMGLDPATAQVRRVVERTYLGPSPFVEPVCYLSGGSEVIFDNLMGSHPDLSDVSHVGGACLRVKPGDERLTVELRDESGLPVSGTVYFADGPVGYIEGNQTGFCQRVTVPIPPGATEVIIAAEATNVWCLSTQTGTPSGPATTGTIIATFAT